MNFRDLQLPDLRPSHWRTLLQQVVSRLLNYILPLAFILSTFVRAIPWTVLHMLLREPQSLFLLDKWRTVLFSYQWPLISAGDQNSEDAEGMRQLLKGAYGNTLEVGAGVGGNFQHYTDKVSCVYAVEPNGGLHDVLVRAADRSAMAGKIKLIASGVEDTASLSRAGVEPKSMDTVVCIHVLCTVDDPRRTIRVLQSLLKDGGQIIFFEHCKSKDPFTGLVQNIFNYFWPYLVYHCRLNLPLDEWLLDLPGWNEPSTHLEDVEPKTARHQLIYNRQGKLVKMRYN